MAHAGVPVFVRRSHAVSHRRWGRGRGGCGCVSGLGSFVLVFLVGGALSLFGVVFGLGVSVGVPFMNSNVSVAGAIGAKAVVADVLPTYLRGRLAGDQNFVNQSITLTVGPAKGVTVFVIGAQEGAPAVDLYLALR